MKCPFCGENLIEGNFTCPHCRRYVIDFDYLDNMDKMGKKYSKSSLLELSKEKLTFEEIVTIYTFIERVDRHFGDGEFSEGCGGDETFSNLSK